MLSGVDGGEHFVIGLTAGREWSETIAIQQREVREARDVLDKGGEVEGVVAEGAIEGFFGGGGGAAGAIGQGLAAAQIASFTLNAIYAEGDIKQRADDWREPDD